MIPRHGCTAVASFVGALAGIAAAGIVWAAAEGEFTGREPGMDLLNIPFPWIRGSVPLLNGMAVGWSVQKFRIFSCVSIVEE